MSPRFPSRRAETTLYTGGLSIIPASVYRRRFRCRTANWDVRFERGGNEQSKVQRKASRVFAWSLDGRPYVKLHGYPSRLKMDTT